jgi:hypothetical protein
MRTLQNRGRTANVVAVFDNQLDSDEALLRLRLAGFRDDRIGYFSHDPNGQVVDLLSRNFWLTGAAVGGVVGAALGVLAARLVWGWSTPDFGGLDWMGLTTTCAVFGALFAGLVGGLVGLAMSRRLVIPPELGETAGPLVLAVSAGDDRERAAALLRQQGGLVSTAEGTAEAAYPHAVIHPA